MSLSVLTRKRLWGRAGNRCGIADCRRELNESSESVGGGVITGHEAHIVAREHDGARGDSPLTAEQRDDYDNLVLLCPTHHKIVDTDVEAFPVERLHQIKDDHELWVRTTLGSHGQATIERYASILDAWSETVRLDRWEDITDGLANAKGPGLPAWAHEALVSTDAFLRFVVWPRQLPELERALQNFGLGAHDFLAAFEAGGPHAEHDGKWIRMQSPRHPYSEQEWQRFAQRRDLVTDLALEMTRAANHACAVAREAVDPQFLVGLGHLGVTFRTDDPMFPKYRPSEVAALYPGADDFPAVRAGRDYRTPAIGD